MEDIIDIIVTETTNLIEITSQPTDEVIDVNIIDNREDIVLNVTPTVVEININSLTGNFGVNWGDIDGTLSNQTDLQNALNLKADLVDGKVPSSQLPSYVDDIIEVATYSALPTTGETGKIYVVLDTNLIYRWSGSAYIEIKDSSAVWGAITGTLSSQTDLQNALNAKVPYTGATGNVNLGEYGATVGYLGFDTTPSGTPTGIGTMYWDSANRTVSLIDGDGDTSLQLGQEERVLVHNNTGSTLTDGQVVYVTGSTGELPSVALAVNTSDSTSSVTFGIVTESIAHGADGFITTSGIVHGLNTNAFTEGAALWLGSTAGTFTETKPVAPAHAVLVGYVIKKSGGNGSIFVKIQNGYELDELHDVLITSKANNDGLFYESSSGLWKNKSIATVLGYTPANGANYLPLTGGTLTGTLNGTNITITNSLIAKGGTFNGGASYGGIVTIDGLGSDLLMNRANTSNGSSITLLTDAVEKWNIGLRSSGATDNFFIYNSNLSANSLTISSATSAATFTSSVTASAIYLTNMTAGSGALYYSTGANRLTLANYNANGIVLFEVNGGATALTLNSNLSATFASTLSATGATLTGALSGTSATFTTDLISQYHTVQDLGNTGDYVLRFKNNSGTQIAYIGRIASDNKTYYSNSNGHSFTGGAATFTSQVYSTKVVNSSTISNTPGDASFLLYAPTTTNYYGGIIGWAEGNLAASISAYDDGSGGALGLSFATGNNTTLSERFKISSTGAATFSSSVTATSLMLGGTTGDRKLEVQKSSTSNFDAFRIAGGSTTLLDFTTTSVGNSRMSINDSTGTTKVYLSSYDSSYFMGGNVGIGTTAPATPLEVNGVIRSSKNEIGFQTLGLGSKLEVYSASYENIAAFRSIPGDGINPYLLINTSSSGITLEENGSSYGALMFKTGATERMRITSGGNVGIGENAPSTRLAVNLNNGTAGNNVAVFGDSAGSTYSLGVIIQNVNTISYNATNTGIKIGSNTSSGRSVNASGTVNAMGLDYAEYMTKSTSENINKGDIVGIDTNGLLTDLYELSISFGIKSTNPSFVGGDGWGADKEDINVLEKERQKVDRIAFSGQVPCNVLGANVGDYIIPVNENGKIKGIAVSNPTFEQYQISVGKVWKIMEDGRAWVAVKIG